VPEDNASDLAAACKGEGVDDSGSRRSDMGTVIVRPS
jgi:hypothetical protein